MNRIIETNFFYVDMANLTTEQLIAFGFLVFIIGVILIHASSIIFRAASIALSFVEPVLKQLGETIKMSLTFNAFSFKSEKATSKPTTTTPVVSQAMAVRVSSTKTIHKSSVSELDEKLMAIPAYARKDANKHYPIFG